MNFPLNILHNTRGQAVSIELRNGETVNGCVMRSDRSMNIILKNTIRTSADGKQFYRCRESFIRGSSVRNIRMEERALKLPKQKQRRPQHGQPSLKVEKSVEFGSSKSSSAHMKAKKAQ